MPDCVIIVEGRRDRDRLLPLLRERVEVVCTYGVPTHERLLQIAARAREAEVAIFTDNDRAGKRIRGILSDEFPDALHLHTKAEYGGVETTPLDYLQQLLVRHDLAPEAQNR